MPRPQLFRLTIAQFAMALLTAAAFLAKDHEAAYSALCGGVIYALPNLYFGISAFQYQGARAAREIVNSFYKGEAVKLILVAVLFTLTFKWLKPLNVPALFTGFVLVMMTNWAAPWLIGRTGKKDKAFIK